MEPQNFSIIVPGVGGINTLIGVLERQITDVTDNDIRFDQAGYHIGSVSRRRVREQVRISAGMLINLWDQFLYAHLQEKCEHDFCKLNTLDADQLQDHVDDAKMNVQEFIDFCDTLDEAAGDEIVPDPERNNEGIPSGIAETLARILGYASPN